MSLSRSTISSDINHLLSISNEIIYSILNPSISSSTLKSNEKPIEILNEYSSFKANNEDSQKLSKAYIDQMKFSKNLQIGGEVENLGERIDELRDRGQNLQEVLSEVKV
ncbi:uncharacterized protein I206_107037 [Kwoniella pini CBS 10737]|uniref:Uncharacterized protein n=1 Tax=Kwoniella pini CBS 10737 TaxID=1296096 RepID=A0A1B9HZF7_9TREE|nr:uncharacterized protein I206_05420 [Kwoniella pini CBS 10737]OCF48640.1 hypothetical protein I206_05420 [Kwoniella pini CBS 10737]